MVESADGESVSLAAVPWTEIARLAGVGELDRDEPRIIVKDDPVTSGDVIVGLHPEHGLLRGVVLEGSDPRNPTIQSLKPSFGAGIVGSFEMPAGSFRPVEASLDPGSLVALHLVDDDPVLMVVGKAGERVVLLDERGGLRTVHRSGVTPLPVELDVEVGDPVLAPFFGSGFEPATVKRIQPGFVFVAYDDFPDSEQPIGVGALARSVDSLEVYRVIEP